MTTEKKRKIIKRKMAKTKTGLEPPTSVLTADVPTIYASHLLFYITHLYSYIRSRLGGVFLQIDSPCMHVHINILLTPLPTVLACICIYVYCYSYLHHLLLQILQWNYCGCQGGVEGTQGGPHLVCFTLHNLSWDQKQLFKLWEATCRVCELTDWL